MGVRPQIGTRGTAVAHGVSAARRTSREIGVQTRWPLHISDGIVRASQARRWHMAGTIVCGVGDSAEGRDAIQLAAALSRRLGLRLVLVHVRPKTRGGESLLY